MKAIQERVVPEIRQALKDALAQHVPEDKILSKTFTNGTSTLTVHLSPEAWLQILDILQPSRNPTEMCWRWRAKTLKWESSSRKLERLLYCIDPRYRAGNVHYRETGVLLPYGAKCGHFDVFNP